MSAHNSIQGENRPVAKRYLVYRYLSFYEHPALLADYAVQHGLETVYRELASLRRALKDELPAPLRSLYACVMLEMLGIEMPSGIDPRRSILQQLRERAHHQGDDVLRDRCEALLAGTLHFRSLDTCRYWTVPHRTTVVRGKYPYPRVWHQLSDGRMLCKVRYVEPNEHMSWYWVLLHEDGSYDRELYHLETYTFVSCLRRDDRLVLLGKDGRLWLTSVDEETLIPMEGHTVKRTLYNAYRMKELADGRMVSFGRDSFFCVWSSDGKLLLKLGDYVSSSVQLWRDDEKVWLGDQYGSLQLWSPNGSYLMQVQAGDARITWLYGLSGSRMVSCDVDGQMKLWSQEGNLIADCGVVHRALQGILEVADGKWISYSTRQPGLALLWGARGEALGKYGLREGEELRYLFPRSLPEGRMCIGINANGMRWLNSDGSIASEVLDDAAIVLSIPVGDKILTLGRGIWDRLWNPDATPAAELRTPGCEELEILRNNFAVISEPHFRLWDLDFAEYHEWRGHNEEVISIHEDADGNLRTYGMDGALRVWGADGTALAAHETHLHGLAIRLSSDQFVVRRVGLGSGDHPLTYCIVGDPFHLIQLEASERTGVYFPLTLGGRFLTSGSRNSTIWDRDGSLHERIPHTIKGSISLPEGRDVLYGYGCGLILYGDHVERLIDAGATYNGALFHSSGHVLAWTSRGFRIWTLDGRLVAEMPRYGRDRNGAVEVSDGRILTWSQSRDRKAPYMPVLADLDLWSSQGELLNAIQSTRIYVNGALNRPDGGWVTWGYSAPCWWSSDGQPQRIGIGDSSCGMFALSDGRLISCGGQGVYLWSADGELLTAHHVHDSITAAHLHSSGVLVVGDCVGRVRFLEIT